MGGQEATALSTDRETDLSAALSETKRRREFDFTEKDFAFIKSWIKEQAGISLSDNKKQLVYGRLAKRIRELGLGSFRDYCDLLLSPEGQKEIGTTLNALTTNLTKFFREKHHFEHLATAALPEIRARQGSSPRPRLRIWSAGCSSGQEPYSIAITLRSKMSDLARWDARILATDIDTNMVEHGREGVYDWNSIEPVPEPLRKRYLKPTARDGDSYRATEDIRSLITFKPLNLLGQWPMRGPFDVIFCRNVVIYFDKDTQRVLFDRYANLMKDGGYLYVGHSESLFKVSDRFKLIGQSIYQKVA